MDSLCNIPAGDCQAGSTCERLLRNCHFYHICSEDYSHLRLISHDSMENGIRNYWISLRIRIPISLPNYCLSRSHGATKLQFLRRKRK